jgi:PAS domain S-box-containing protein
MQEVHEVLRYVNVLVFAALAFVTFTTWKRRRDAPSGWAAATFGVLALVSLAGVIGPEDPQGTGGLWYTKILISVLALFPYFLYRFASAFQGVGRMTRWVAIGLTGAVILDALLMSDFPGPDDPRTASFNLFLTLFLMQWSALLVFVAARLWRAGTGQPGIVRKRMRLLAVASVALTVAILIAGAAPQGGNQDQQYTSQVITQLLALVSGALFFLGWSPPASMVSQWRREEQGKLREATEQLMTSKTTDEVVNAVLPHVGPMVGAQGVALVSVDGEILGSSGVGSDEVDVAAVEGQDNVLSVSMPYGKLLVWTNPYAPFFAEEEIGLLRSLVSLTFLSLERVQASEAEAVLATLVRTSQDAIIGADAEGTIVSWNQGAENVFGYSAGEAVGSHIRILAPEDSRERQEEIMVALRSGNAVEPYEAKRLRKDGSAMDVLMTVSPIKDRDGEVTGFSAIARDISRLKQAEEYERRLEDAKNRQQQAMQLNDSVVQGLVVAKMAMDLDERPRAEEAISRTLTAARRIVSGLIDDARAHGELKPGDLVRDEPAGVIPPDS